jgi:hypothetical protein
MRSGLAATLLVCLGLLGASAAGQEQTASIVGVVRDASGGVVPGASVTAAHTGGLSVQAATNGRGRYRFPRHLVDLQVGPRNLPDDIGDRGAARPPRPLPGRSP